MLWCWLYWSLWFVMYQVSRDTLSLESKYHVIIAKQLHYLWYLVSRSLLVNGLHEIPRGLVVSHALTVSMSNHFDYIHDYYAVFDVAHWNAWDDTFMLIKICLSSTPFGNWYPLSIANIYHLKHFNVVIKYISQGLCSNFSISMIFTWVIPTPLTPPLVPTRGLQI